MHSKALALDGITGALGNQATVLLDPRLPCIPSQHPPNVRPLVLQCWTLPQSTQVHTGRIDNSRLEHSKLTLHAAHGRASTGVEPVISLHQSRLMTPPEPGTTIGGAGVAWLLACGCCWMP